jgi:hypothetical protein
MKRSSVSEAESNAKRYEKAAAKTREVIRVFPDYAGTVVWFQGPVPYEETGLSQRLIDDMEDWEAAYYASLDELHSFASKRAESIHVTRGLTIARALSDEIGDLLPIEADGIGGAKTRLLTPGFGTNPQARTSFATMLAEAKANDADIAATLRSGGRFEWVAYRPGDGQNSRTV